ncbi:MAG TPA: hypothetical protein VNC78_11475 [Actinomycetota bacterium]|nr:hypothetical protein [Actinomycetota bacterium]
MQNPIRAASSRKGHRRSPLKTVFGVVGIIMIVAASVWLASEDGDIPFIALVAALSCIPFVLYMMLVKSKVGIILTGLVLVLVTGALYVSMLGGDSSTGALAFVVSPIVNIVIFGFGWIIDLIARRND